MVDVARARKLAVRVREIVAETLETQVKDPRLGMVTITDAKVTPDLREATLYYTVFGDDVVDRSRPRRWRAPRVSCAAPSASRPGCATPRR
jgi:ribosome-binding factor A